MKQGNKPRTVFIFICLLLISQIIWWIIFNHKQNENILILQKNDLLLREQLLNMSEDSLVQKNPLLMSNMLKHDSIIHIDENYLSYLIEENSKNNIMFISESLFVMIMLILGIFIVYRSYRHERKMSMQQQNFLLSITHELKTPISSVKLLLQTLSRKNIPSDKKLEFINESMNELDRLNNLVSNIIHTTKAESFDTPSNIKHIELSPFIQKTFDALNKRTKAKLEILSQDKYHVDMNEDDLYLILSNLFSNAISYCDEAYCKISILIENKEKSLLLRIADNGIGIPIDERSKIFERFYRIGSEETRNYSGTGIGLYIVKLILKKYNSTITCSANHPKGSIFEISFTKGK